MYLSVHILIFNTSTALTYKERSSSGAQGLWTQRPGFEPSSTPGAGSLGSCTLDPSPQVCLLALGPFLMIRHVGGSPVVLTKCVRVPELWVQMCRQEGVNTGLLVYLDVSW